ncbi:MAG: flagellar basal body rod protein FlgB [Alphaproteobacteria bacterium]|nr:flagellar basal body rod protein FlgB [Alphaproteobacteria bacterium]
MLAAIDTGLDFYRQVLDLRAYRQQILTADIANASTPKFKAVDLDFAAAVESATAELGGRAAATTWLVDDPQHLPPSSSTVAGVAAAAVKYQTGASVTLDGNSVDLNQEKVAAGENAVQYEAAASFASQIVKMLTIAINGSATQPSNGS